MDDNVREITEVEEPTSAAYEMEINVIGTGMGRDLSRKFRQMMGGDIVVDSAVGQGSTFTMKLPAVVVETQIGLDSDVAQPVAG